MQKDEDVSKQPVMKPKAVVINIPQNKDLLAVEPVTNPIDEEPIQHKTMSSSEKTRRIQIASIVLFVSMFFNWGYHYWLKWTIDWPPYADGEGWDDGSHSTLREYLVHGEFAYEGGFGFVEMLNFFFRFQIWGDVADLVGPIFALFIMRELMPFVFIGTLAFCWVNRTESDDFFRKVTLFYGGYFMVMAVQLFYINTELSESDYWEFNILFDCFGFWVAGVAGLILDPRLIRIQENTSYDDEGFIPHLNRPEWALHLGGNTNVPKQGIDYRVFALFYLPLVFHALSIFISIDEGDDDILFLGITVPIIGLLIGTAVYRLEFLKGFGKHLAYSVGYGFMAYFLMIIGLLVILREGVILFVFVIPLIMPIRYHLSKQHIRALGAAYAVPLSVWILLIGLLVGWIQTEGW